MKHIKGINYLTFGIATLAATCAIGSGAYATSVPSADVPGSTYIIGEHMFTRDTNPDKDYEGHLTTNIIMLASQSIKSSDIADMSILYKTASGSWIDGLSGNAISAPDTFNINYKNLSLETENTTVKAPMEPLVYWQPLQNYDKDTGTFPTTVWIALDDIDDNTAKIDGVEITARQNGIFSRTYDIAYNEYFSSNIVTLSQWEAKKSGGIAGNVYHAHSINLNDVKLDQGSGDVIINAKSYTLDGNGKKVYSDSVIKNISSDEYFPTSAVKSTHSNPRYITKRDGYYIYQLELDLPEGWSLDAWNANDYAWVLYSWSGINREVGTISHYEGIFGLGDKVMITVPENSVVSYIPTIGYYKEDGSFIYAGNTISSRFTIDTRTLITPTLEKLNAGPGASKEGGETMQVDMMNYTRACADSGINLTALECEADMVEFYELNPDSSVAWKLVKDSGAWWAKTMPTSGHSLYVARVAVINAAGEKIYSDFSDILEIVRTPQIEATAISGGKTTISIANKSEYGLPSCFIGGENKLCAGYKVYTEDGTMLQDVSSVSDSVTIDATPGMKIYAKAYATFGQIEDSAYSDKSNTITIE